MTAPSRGAGAALRLAGPDDVDAVLRLVAADREERELPPEPDGDAAAVRPLLDGSPHGAIYLVGPPSSPVGYLALSFGWSIDMGGIDARVTALYVRPPVRRRGMAGGALLSLAPALARGGVVAIGVDGVGDAGLRRLFKRAGLHVAGEGARLVRPLS